MVMTSLSGVVNTKNLAKYLKHTRKANCFYVQKQDETLFLSDGFMLVRHLVTADLTEYAASPYERTLYPIASAERQETSINLLKNWEQFGAIERVGELKATRYLYESPRYKGPSDFYRKLEAKDSEKVVWINRLMLDCFSVDPDDLDDFFFFLLASRDMVCVSARYGYVAYLMPANIDQRTLKRKSILPHGLRKWRFSNDNCD